MGNDVFLPIIGMGSILAGFIVGIYTGFLVRTKAESLEFMEALSIYFGGFVLALILIAFGFIILFFASRS